MSSEETIHPSHYNQYTKEVWVITEQCDFCTGSAIKYILRAPYKENFKRDMQKAKECLNRIKLTQARYAIVPLDIIHLLVNLDVANRDTDNKELKEKNALALECCLPIAKRIAIDIAFEGENVNFNAVFAMIDDAIAAANLPLIWRQ